MVSIFCCSMFLGTGYKEYADDDTEDSDDAVEIDVFSEEITTHKDDDEGDSKEWVGVAHLGFRENKKPEDDTDSIEKKSGKKGWIREKSHAGSPDVLLSSKSSGSLFPENLGDPVERSRKE